LIVRLADQYRVPAVYPFPQFARNGGLVSYGVDVVVQFRQAAPYVNRILKGEKPGELPVQAPTKFETDHQCQNRQGARPQNSRHIARARRRGDRMIFRLFAAVH
jgi:ABC-type uncharacterized transport system substrate-binding protein